MTSDEENTERLFRALAAADEPTDHAACQAGLPAYIEAEMADENVALLFPDVQAHLDICQVCGSLHAEILDVLLADEAGLIPEPSDFPAPVLPAPVRLRQLARQIAGMTLDALQLSRGELESAAEAFFDALSHSAGRLELATAAQAMGLGELDTPALPLVMASYSFLEALSRQWSDADVRALAEKSQVALLLDGLARQSAKRAGLSGAQHDSFVRVVKELALADPVALNSLLAAVRTSGDLHDWGSL